MRSVMLAAAAVLVAGCIQVVSVIPAATGGSKADGNVVMSYEFSAAIPVQPDWNSATGEALRRCQAWGYTRVEPFAGETTTCNQYGTGFAASTCLQGVVSRTYQCFD